MEKFKRDLEEAMVRIYERVQERVNVRCKYCGGWHIVKFGHNILRKLCHINLHKEELWTEGWYEVKGDDIWVLYEFAKATGMEIWGSPPCIEANKRKPFHIRFSPQDESLYCDVGTALTLETAKQIAEAYYTSVKPLCQPRLRRT